jgi:hypothetical protein
MLLHRPGHASMDDLISAIWPHPDFEPENVVGQIRIYVVGLRKRGFPVAHAGYGKGYGMPDLMTEFDA